MAKGRTVEDFIKEIGLPGYLGVSGGTPAFAYARVSSDEQATEGKSGIPRQFLHIHEKALEYGCYIPAWNMFFDDASGFEFQDRPELSRLRQTYMNPDRHADVLIMESIDRLSRNADWHQGFLLEEMKKFGLQVLFWKEFTSRIERAVMGAIAQDGMEDAKKRMYDGMILKAKSGRITAKTPAYGYRFVDAEGKQSSKATKETYYAIDEEKAPFIRQIFHMYADGYNLEQLVTWLNEVGAPPPSERSGKWHRGVLHMVLKNPVYKGEYVSGRWKRVKGPPSRTVSGSAAIKPAAVERRIERPEEEWIIVPCPAIVDSTVWDAVQRRFDVNKLAARRNAKRDYLLTGILRCKYCERAYMGFSSTAYSSGKKYRRYYYRCSSQVHPHSREKYNCQNGSTRLKVIEDAIWKAVCDAILEPQPIIDAMDELLDEEQNQDLMHQIRFVQKKIQNNETADERLWLAFRAGAYDEYEFKDKRRVLKEEKFNLQDELNELNAKVITQADIDAKKDQLLETSRRAHEAGISYNAPFEVRRQTLLTVVDRIIIDVLNSEFTIEGTLEGTFGFANDSGGDGGDTGDAGGQGNGRRFDSEIGFLPIASDPTHRYNSTR